MPLNFGPLSVLYTLYLIKPRGHQAKGAWVQWNPWNEHWVPHYHTKLMTYPRSKHNIIIEDYPSVKIFYFYHRQKWSNTAR